MMARQSFHALRSRSALVLSSNRSATSRISVPKAVDDVSAKSAKKDSMRAGGVTWSLRYAEICDRKVAILLASFCSRLDARSITEAWRTRRARSSVVKLGSVSSRPSVPGAGLAVGAAADDEALAWLRPAAAGAAVAEGLAGVEDSCPPKVRFETDWEEWMAICRWKASSSRRRGWAELAGSGSALGSRPRLPRPSLSLSPFRSRPPFLSRPPR